MWWLNSKKRIYLDYASATPVCAEALAAVVRGYDMCGNPGSIHAEGVAAKRLLQESRERIARELAVKARQIIFTSGATEGNNIAILGLARALELKGVFVGTHWIVSSIEHDSVLECFSEIERQGGEVTHVDPDARGIVSAEAVARALRPHTRLVSISWANNEIGIVQPLREIARAIRVYEEEHTCTILLHTDAGQAPLYLSPQVHTLGVDMAVFGSGKLYGPRGIGCLYVDNRVELAPLSFGGSQERGLRAGTENPALAAGFAEALMLAGRERQSEAKWIKVLRDYLASAILARMPETVINGSLDHALPHMLNVSLLGIDTEYLTLALDAAGVSVATKSACRETGEKRSHVVDALTSDEWRAAHTLRFSLGRGTSASDIERTDAALATALASYRKML